MDTYLLMDLDGVLLEPLGYHNALQETVRLVGNSLGFNAAHLSQEDILAFEAVGISSEWDSAAICLGLMLTENWEHDPTVGVPGNISPATPKRMKLPTPDWKTFLEELSSLTQGSESPVKERKASFPTRNPG